MTADLQLIDVVSNGTAEGLLGQSSHEQAHGGNAPAQDVVMSDHAHATISEKSAPAGQQHHEQLSTSGTNAPTAMHGVDSNGEVAPQDKAGERGSVPKALVSSVESRVGSPALTSTLTHRAQTPLSNLQTDVLQTPISNSQSNVFHTPKSTGSKTNVTPSKTPATEADDDVICTGSRPSRTNTPARPASAMSAKYGVATPSRLGHQVMQEVQLQTPTKTTSKRAAPAEDEPGSSKKQKTPASTPVHGRTDTAFAKETSTDGAADDSTEAASTTETDTDEAADDQDSDGEYKEDSETSERNQPEEESVSLQAQHRWIAVAKAKMKQDQDRFRASTAMIQQLNEKSEADDKRIERLEASTDALREEIETLREKIAVKDHEAEERDDEIQHLERVRDKLSDRDVMFVAQIQELKENEARFLERFEVQWEERAKRTVEAKNAREMKRQEDRAARLTERLQVKANKALEEARAIREQSKAEIREVKADRDAKVKAAKPEFNVTLRRKDEELKKKYDKMMEYEFKIQKLVNMHNRKNEEVKALQEDKFKMEQAHDDLVNQHETSRQQLKLTTEMCGNQIVETDKLKKEYKGELAAARKALDKKTQTVQRLQDELEAANGKLNWYTAAQARGESSSNVVEDRKDSPRGGQDLPASPRSSASTAGRSPNSLPGDINMLDQTKSQGPPINSPGKQHGQLPGHAQKQSPPKNRRSFRVDSDEDE